MAGYGSGVIARFDTTTGGSRSAFATGLISPIGLILDSAGNLYVGDYDGAAVYRFGTDAPAQQSLPEDYSLMGLPSTKPEMFTWQMTDYYEIHAQRGASVFANVSLPFGLTFDSQGYLYASSYFNQTILRFDSLSRVTTVFATASIGLNGPVGIQFDASGNLFVAKSMRATISLDGILPGIVRLLQRLHLAMVIRMVWL
ncbi:MAG: hypothetical protein U1F83_04765 [Verrucomicrobiota bacterium]